LEAGTSINPDDNVFAAFSLCLMGYKDIIRMIKEFPVQCEIVLWLNSLQPEVLFCASAGGMRTSIGVAKKMKRAGYKRGFPDIFIYEPRGKYHGLALEVKFQGTTQVEQKDWKAKLEARSYKAIIMPNNLDFQEAIEWAKREIGDYLK